MTRLSLVPPHSYNLVPLIPSYPFALLPCCPACPVAPFGTSSRNWQLLKHAVRPQISNIKSFFRESFVNVCHTQFSQLSPQSVKIYSQFARA